MNLFSLEKRTFQDGTEKISIHVSWKLIISVLVFVVVMTAFILAAKTGGGI